MKYTNDPIINLVIKRHIQRHNQGMKKFKKTPISDIKNQFDYVILNERYPGISKCI